MDRVFVGLVFILLCGLGGWYLANPNLWNNRSLENSASVSPAPELALVRPLPAADLSFIEGAGQTSCNAPSTRGVGPRESSIYRWTDAQGQMHFSDEKPAAVNAELYDVDQGVTLDYFELEINYRGRNTIPFLEGQLSAQATSIYEIMAGLVGDENLRRVQLNVVIFPDATSFRQYARTLTGDKVDHLDGLYSTRTNEALTYTADDDARTMEVTKHEATHVIVRGIFGTLPVWLNEGLAEYFSKLNIRGQLAEVIANEEALQLARATLQGGYPAVFADFLQLPNEDWYNTYQSNHYALAGSMIHFMMETDAGRQTLTNLLRQMAAEYCQPRDGAAGLARLYPGGLNALREEFYAWLTDDAVKAPHTY